MRQHEVRRHEAAVAPAVDTEAIGIHPGLALEELHPLHLVGHLVDAELAMYDLLEVCATSC